MREIDAFGQLQHARHHIDIALRITESIEDLAVVLLVVAAPGNVFGANSSGGQPVGEECGMSDIAREDQCLAVSMS